MDKKAQQRIRLEIIRLMDQKPRDMKRIQELGRMLNDIPTKKKGKIIIPNIEKPKEKFLVGDSEISVIPNVYMDLKEKGYLRSEIAEYFNLTVGELVLEIKLLQYHGFLPKRINLGFKNLENRLSKEKYLQYKKEGMKDWQICQLLRIAQPTLTRLKKAMGLCDNRGTNLNYSHITFERFCELRNSGMTYEQIAKEFKISRCTLFDIRKGWNNEQLQKRS